MINTDQGTEFNNHLSGSLIECLKIKHNLTTAYHPQTNLYYFYILIFREANLLDKRFNHTLQNMLVKSVSERKNLWEQCLGSCLCAYNTSCHESTHYLPYELIFGRKPIFCCFAFFMSRQRAHKSAKMRLNDMKCLLIQRKN